MTDPRCFREALIAAIAELPQPTLGLAGGVSRAAVIDAIDRVFAAPTLDVEALEQVLFERTNGKGRWRPDLAPLIRESWTQEARLIAAEYARLVVTK